MKGISKKESLPPKLPKIPRKKKAVSTDVSETVKAIKSVSAKYEDEIKHPLLVKEIYFAQKLSAAAEKASSLFMTTHRDISFINRMLNNVSRDDELINPVTYFFI
jgi:hypothetical protein